MSESAGTSLFVDDATRRSLFICIAALIRSGAGGPLNALRIMSAQGDEGGASQLPEVAVCIIERFNDCGALADAMLSVFGEVAPDEAVLLRTASHKDVTAGSDFFEALAEIHRFRLGSGRER